MKWTAEQRAVIESPNSLVVVGGPGTGKTAILLARYEHILDLGYSPKAVAMVTFTRFAAHQLLANIGKYRLPLPGFIGTTTAWAWQVVQSIAPDTTVLSPLDEDAAQKHLATFGKVTPEMWDQYKAKSHYVAIGDVVQFAADLLNTHPLAQRYHANRTRVVLWDEFQDSNEGEVQFLAALDPKLVFLIADPDQSIYGFRGAVPQVVNEARAMFGADMHRLHITHRFGPGLVIRTIPRDRLWRDVTTQQKKGGTIAILGRYNRTIDRAHYNAQAEGVPTTLLSAKHDDFSEEPWPTLYKKARVAITPLHKRPGWMVTEQASMRIPYTPSQQLAKTEGFAPHLVDMLPLGIETLADFVRWYPVRSVKDQISGRTHKQDTTHIMTIHASKGLEFDTVYLLDPPETVMLPGYRPDPDNEDSRVWYVGKTRAKKQVVFVVTGGKNDSTRTHK